MKTNSILILVASIIFFIISIIFFTYVMKKEPNDNMGVTIKVVILEVHSNNLTVMGIDNQDLYILSMGKKGNIGYKKGQELLVYYDGMIATSYPEQILNVGKIEIIKEKTDIVIPDEYLKFYNTPTNNISASLINLTRTGMTFSVSSEIEIPFDHSEIYYISKTGNYSSGGLEGISYFEKLESKDDFPIEDTINLEGESNGNFVKYDIDWSHIYGELEEFDERRICISIIKNKFT